MTLLNNWWQTPRIRTLVFILISLIVVFLYLGISASFDTVGFPLDDAWIHQTYARNFARNGRWEFIPGVVSGGSTSPLWTLLLALGYMLRMPYLGWAYSLGFISLLMVGFSAFAISQKLWPEQKQVNCWATIAILGTWPLIWAAVSGMETLLFVGVGLLTISLLLNHLSRGLGWSSLIGLGFSSGLLILIRPDGLLPILLVFAALFLKPHNRWQQLFIYLLTITAVLAPYFLFNWSISGTIWPNTFYAKQAEYAILLETAIIQRFFQLLYFSLGGASSGLQGISASHLLLFPGLVFAGWRAVNQDWREKRLFMFVPFLWAVGHVALYAWRLPLTFQHGRYLMAATPIWLLYGFAGWWLLWQRLNLSQRLAWMLKQTGLLTYGFLTSLFLIFGAQAYARDVAFIENEMVHIGQWISENLPSDATLASHDIGAIGYFAERPLLDLAGLISPDIVPYINDEPQLAIYVLESPASYLITAPGWPYEEIVNSSHVELVYSSNYPFTRENGLNNMTIYLLDTP